MVQRSVSLFTNLDIPSLSKYSLDYLLHFGLHFLVLIVNSNCALHLFTAQLLVKSKGKKLFNTSARVIHYVLTLHAKSWTCTFLHFSLMC